MTALTWDAVGQRFYETGVDRGVLYLPDAGGDYNEGFAWNGLTTVTETPSGAESNPQFADNIKYLNLLSAETFGGTIEAFTYPDEFMECDGTAVPSPGVAVGQQGRRVFGLSYRSQLGNDIDGVDHGFKLHLVYGAQAAPSEKAYATINDSPEAIAFSWEISTTPIPVTGLKPTSLIVINSTEVDAGALATLLGILHGDADSDARLPQPDEVIALFGGAVTEVSLAPAANQPVYNAGTHVITVPAVAGVQWRIDGENVANGAQPALAPGDIVEVTAVPTPGNVITSGDTDWTFEY